MGLLNLCVAFCDLTDCASLQRQAFFRKKLLQSSHSMRATLLGQDRYRRRYLVLPHLGGVLVEGPEELLSKSYNKTWLNPSFRFCKPFFLHIFS